MRMRLDNWSYGTGEVDLYTPPEMIRPRLQGNIYGHPTREDGKRVTTSPVVGQRNGLVVTQSGSEYELLTPEKCYEEAFPNVKERLFKSLPQV